MKINGILITERNLEEHYEFSEEEFLGRTDTTCGICKGKGHYKLVNHKTECDECEGTGSIDGDNEVHECGPDWESEDMDFDDDAHVSIDRTCPVCNQLSRLHFWRIKK